MIKKILKTTVLIALLIVLGNFTAHTLTTSPPTAHAFTQLDDLRPINEPFSINKELKSGGAAFATIVVLQIIAGGLLYFAAPIAIIMFGFAGWNLVFGGADQEKIDQGRKQLIWTTAGLFLIILSYSAVKFIIQFVMQAATP